MFSTRRTRAILILLQVLLGFLGVFHGLVYAQGGSVEVPRNAHAKSYGNGWECDNGYREVNGGCATVKVPSNAYLNDDGDRWKCDRGYRKAGGACVAVKVAENAHLDYSGNDWECNRPYRKQQNKCIKRKEGRQEVQE